MPPLNTRVAILEAQFKRIVSDIESEKGTRARSHSALDERLRKVERSIYMAAGGLGVLQILLSYLTK